MTGNEDQEIDAVAEGDAYDLIRRRLLEHVGRLEDSTNALNKDREAAFGTTNLEVLSRVRVRTEHNCVPRDIVRVGERILFGYNVFIGLKRETAVEDVFAAYTFQENDGKFEIVPDTNCEFLQDESFLRDFRDLYAYYSAAHLARMQVIGPNLYVTFRIGDSPDDIRVFHWQIGVNGQVKYVDDRAERAVPKPPAHQFTWTRCGREQIKQSSHPAYSLDDTIFVEITNGCLVFKVEDNTEAGTTVLSEPLEESNQTLNDLNVSYVIQSGLMIIGVLPYGEADTRYYTFDSLTQNLERHDEIGIGVRELPEDHGVIFPGGYVLTGGASRRFEDDVEGLGFSRQINSPNGEDVLYVFYEREAGRYGLYAYNLIYKTLQNPIYAHGYSLFQDGTLIVFRSETDEPTRSHPMQVWRTSFADEDQIQQNQNDGPLIRIGNSELVRGVSDLFAIVQTARSEKATIAGYTSLIANCRRLKDSYYWLGESDFSEIGQQLEQISSTAELVLDEFEKVAQIRAHANQALQDAEERQQQLTREVVSSDWHHARDYVRALGALRKQRGHLMTVLELRYIDRERVQLLEQEVIKVHDKLAEDTVDFLLRDDALEPYRAQLNELTEAIPKATNSVDLNPIDTDLSDLSAELDLITEVLGSLTVDDATRRTSILESISELFASLNAAKAKTRNAASSLGSGEAKAEFAAQFTLFSQSATNALAQAITPDECDNQYARLIVALEELEGRFGIYDEFLPDIIAKREEVQDAFDAHRQGLLDARQRRAQKLFEAADRILDGISRRTARAADINELNTYFTTDTMVVKLKDTIGVLRSLDDSVKADDLQSRLKSAQDNAVRALRDKTDIYENEGALIRLGRHRFTVNQQPLELTIIPGDDAMHAHLTGTGYSEKIGDAELLEFQDQWRRTLISETETIYRGEYLAFTIFQEAEAGATLTRDELQAALLDDQTAAKLVRKRAADRYREAFEKGVHDHDAVKILQAIVPRIDELGLLTYGAPERALALLFWKSVENQQDKLSWRARANTAALLAKLYPGKAPYERLLQEIAQAISTFLGKSDLRLQANISQAATYLASELSGEDQKFTVSQRAHDLMELLKSHLRDQGAEKSFMYSVDNAPDIGTRFHVAYQWLSAIAEDKRPEWLRAAPEAAALMLMPGNFNHKTKSTDPNLSVSDLLGQHPRIQDGKINIVIDEFISRIAYHHDQDVPRFEQFQKVRHKVSQRLKSELNLGAFIARPLSSFVRNKLIDDAYLPMIGDNLAKQLGAADDAKRTDLMGMLMLISPPGYGKTTLMEYVADRLGLIFVKVNGPALGHSVVSVDPSQAPNATARQELEKLNLAFEMGNNVMLYVDDIQHTNPEFLQKFISLCDGTRRIEGVWRGEPKTYDLRGRRFCVIMAGNPYTESGDMFQIPDMLANRADVYNLGDVLSGKDEAFALSYIENSLTSNPTLAPLATRDMGDVYRFIDRAAGRSVPSSDFTHAYSTAEASEIVSVLQKMLEVQKVILAVNQEYIRSAATHDSYRTEPPFKLQGSYRNMNKLAEKILPIMNDDEIQSLIDDHYVGESQLLTSEAEFNMLRLAELRERITEEQAQRLAEIRSGFQRNQSMGGEDADIGMRLANQLAFIRESLDSLASGLQRESDVGNHLNALNKTIREAEITVVNQPSKVVEDAIQQLAQTIETTFMPVVASMNKKIDLDLAMLRRINDLRDSLDIDVDPEDDG